MPIFVIRHADKAGGDFHHDALPLNDQPLSEEGVRRAAHLVAFFEGIELDSVRASEYARTSQTIRPLAEARDLPVVVDARLNEIDIGETEDLEDERVAALYPDFWRAWVARDRDFRFPGGETGDEATARAWSLFESLDPAGNHVLVTHDGITRLLLCRALGLPSYKRHFFTISTCSVTEFRYSAAFRCWTVRTVNREMPGSAA